MNELSQSCDPHQVVVVFGSPIADRALIPRLHDLPDVFLNLLSRRWSGRAVLVRGGVGLDRHDRVQVFEAEGPKAKMHRLADSVSWRHHV